MSSPSTSVPGRPAYETGQQTVKVFRAVVRAPHVVDRLCDERHGRRAVGEAARSSWRRSGDSGVVLDSIRAHHDPDVDAGGRLRWAAAPAMAAVSGDLADVEAALWLTSHAVMSSSAGRRRQLAMPWIVGAAAVFVCDEAIGGMRRNINYRRSRLHNRRLDRLQRGSCAAPDTTACDSSSASSTPTLLVSRRSNES